MSVVKEKLCPWNTLAQIKWAVSHKFIYSAEAYFMAAVGQLSLKRLFIICGIKKPKIARIC